jgi:hypothetical protein
LKFFLGKNSFKVINSFSLSITKFGLIPIFITGTVLANIFPFLSIMLDLKLSFFEILLIVTFSFKLSRITFEEKTIAIIKKQRK